MILIYLHSTTCQARRLRPLPTIPWAPQAVQAPDIRSLPNGIGAIFSKLSSVTGSGGTGVLSKMTLA